MIFSSLIFVFLFLPIVLLIYYIICPFSTGLKNVWLLMASLFFYAWGEPKFVLIMIVSIFANYILGMGIDFFTKRNIKRLFLALALCFNIGLLFVFKYLDFTIESINRIIPNPLTKYNIALPIGISFFTFQAISYIVDVYRGTSKGQYNPIGVGLYISFFPQLIAGPIVRYETIEKQISNRNESVELFANGTIRFLRGFCKKVLLANPCGLVADEVFHELAIQGSMTGSYAWIGVLAYSLQIFYDFSGYSDMAIGLGKMFGFHFEENFNYPYFADSITDFWRRWHISLGRWFRDYFYIPLGGSRVKRHRLLMNLFIVWCATGIWHGANWTFIVWGLWYFVLLAMEKILDLPGRLNGNVFAKGAYRLFTIFSIMIGWAFFRAPSISRALDLIKAMFGLNSYGWKDDRTLQILHENYLVLGIALVLAVPLIQCVKKYCLKKFQSPRTVAVLQILRVTGYIILFLYAISFLVVNFYNPFIYFNF